MKPKGAVQSCRYVALFFSFSTLVMFSKNASAETELVAVVSETKDVITIVEDVSLNVLQAWNVADNINSGSIANNLPQILTRFQKVSSDIFLTEDQHAEPVNNFINLQLFAKRNDITNAILGIKARFKEFKELTQNQAKIESTTLMNFADWTVSPNGFSVHHLMDRLHYYMFGSDDEVSKPGSNIFETLAHSYGSQERCINHQSTQQFIYSLYTDIVLTEVKAYAMQQFSYMILKTYGRGNFTKEAELKRNNYEQRTKKTVHLLNKVMQKADCLVWRCDPERHIEGETYEEVTRFLQGYIENEVDMSSDRDCMQSCAAYGRTKNEGCYMEQFCARQERCAGQIHDCYDAGSMKVCPSPLEGMRRYEYIEINGNINGRSGICARGESVVEFWRRYLFWDCSYCVCLCDDQDSPKTDRYLNLRDTLSNVNKNMVITGLRFTKVNRIFHLQIQEAELMPRGMTNASTIRWKPVDSFTLHERGVNNNQDYFTLTYDARSIDLDDIKTDDPSLVVTGVRFRLVRGHLNIQARFSKFDFVLGQLINPTENSFWKFNDMQEYKRTKIDLSDLDVSVYTTAKSVPIFNPNQYLQFSPTSLQSDASQTTIPFIDIQDVISLPSVPLAGIGIYYKRSNGYGGFIAPKITTLDYLPYIHTPRTS